MPKHRQCEAELYEPRTETMKRCANTAAARVTTDGEEQYLCRAHTKLSQEFLRQARLNAIRWSAVMQIAEPSDV